MYLEDLCIALSALENIGPHSIWAFIHILLGDEASLEDDPSLTTRVFSNAEITAALNAARRSAVLSHARLATIEAAVQQFSAIAEREKESCVRHNVILIPWWSSAYPVAVRELEAAPPLLWAKGALAESAVATSTPLADRSVALVGSREADEYGLQVVSALVPGLCSAGVVTVSGGAVGIDTAVHRETLRAGGSTVAVLGGGLGCHYPPQNGRLFEDITSTGALISGVPYYTTPHKGLFPARNVLIAALSRMTVVVQAAAKSGALLTAQYALELNRIVGAVPGSLFSERSAGGHRLLREGAVLVDSPSVILQECGFATQGAQLVRAKRRVPTDAQLSFVSEQLSGPAAEVVVFLGTKKYLATTIATELDLEFGALMSLLFTLQQDGRVVQDHSGYWSVVRLQG